MVLKEGGGPLCSLDCDPSSRSLSLKVLAQGTNEPLGRERSIPCCPGDMAVPGFSPLFCQCNFLLQAMVDLERERKYDHGRAGLGGLLAD